MATRERAANGLRISGTALKVLIETMEREINAPFEWADAPVVMDRTGLSAHDYRGAVEELTALGLVTADTSISHASGYARTRLHPTGFLAVAPTLMPDVDVEAEARAVLAAVHHTDPPRVAAKEILEQTGIPVGRFDLYARAFRRVGLLQGNGPASGQFGSFHSLEITDEGRRVAEGVEPWPWE